MNNYILTAFDYIAAVLCKSTIVTSWFAGNTTCESGGPDYDEND